MAINTSLIGLLFISALPLVTFSQEIEGVIKTKTTYISFSDFGLPSNRINGSVKQNLLGSKFKINLLSNHSKLSGEVYEKLSHFIIDLRYGDEAISGKIKKSTNRTSDQWNVTFLGKSLSGTIRYNVLKNKATYNLLLDDIPFTGSVQKSLNTHEYDLHIGSSSIEGTMTLNLTSVKHSYALKTADLSDNDFLVFFFVELIQLMNYEIWNAEDFQENDTGIFNDN